MFVLAVLVFALGTMANSCVRLREQGTNPGGIFIVVGLLVALAVLSVVVSKYRSKHGGDVGPIS